MTKAEYKTRIRELEVELRTAKNNAADALLKLETIRVALGPATVSTSTGIFWDARSPVYTNVPPFQVFPERKA